MTQATSSPAVANKDAHFDAKLNADEYDLLTVFREEVAAQGGNVPEFWRFEIEYEPSRVFARFTRKSMKQRTRPSKCQ